MPSGTSAREEILQEDVEISEFGSNKKEENRSKPDSDDIISCPQVTSSPVNEDTPPLSQCLSTGENGK